MGLHHKMNSYDGPTQAQFQYNIIMQSRLSQRVPEVSVELSRRISAVSVKMMNFLK